MNQNILLVIATGVGIAAGSGATYVLMPQPDPQVRAPTHEEIVAAVEADPSLLPREFVAPALETPSEEEALAAYRRAYSSNPMRARGSEDRISIRLGECDQNPAGPGVSCLTSIKFTPSAQPLDRVIGYSKSALGDWVATGY